MLAILESEVVPKCQQNSTKTLKNRVLGGSQKLLGEVLELLGAMVARQNRPSLKNKATSALVGSQLEGQNFTLC